MNHPAQLAAFARLLEQKGLLNGLEGNASVIDRETGLTYITPSARMKLLLTEDMICGVNASGEQVCGTGRRSSEYLLHEAIYTACPNVGAIIHSHCPYLTAYALRYQDFVVPEDCSLHLVFQRFICLPWGTPGTHEVHRGIDRALSESPICLLGGHGVVCVAEDLERCTGFLDAAETLAKTLFLAKHI